MSASLTTPTPRRRLAPWLWILLALFALAVGVAGTAVAWVSSLDLSPVHIVVDGTEHMDLDLASLTTGGKLALTAGLVIALLAVIVVVPVALVIGLAGIAIGLVFGIGLPLLFVLVVAVLVLSPLLLVLALAGWLWRRSGRTAAQPANIPA